MLVPSAVVLKSAIDWGLGLVAMNAQTVARVWCELTRIVPFTRGKGWRSPALGKPPQNWEVSSHPGPASARLTTYLGLDLGNEASRFLQVSSCCYQTR